MPRLFLDSSVLFAMCDSSRGAARELLKFAIRQRVQLVTSQYALDETQITLTNKRPEALTAFSYIKRRPFWTVIEATHKEAQAAEGTTPDIFDTPIVAAAKKAKVDALVTFDRKHLIRQSVSDYIEAIVTTPSEIVKRIRAESKD